MDWGIYYIVVNDSGMSPLELSIQSLLKHHPDIPIALATDFPKQAEQSFGSKVNIIPVPKSVLPNRPSYPDHGFFSKVRHMGKSPFEFTLFLDFDTYIIGSITDAFVLLANGNFDMAMAHDVGRSANCPYASTIPLAFRQFNTGVIAYKNNAIVNDVLNNWWKNMVDLDSAWGDQPAFMKAVYESSDLRYATLPCEYNLRFIYPQAPYNDVVILHGRPSERDYLEKISRNVNRNGDTSRFWFKDRCYGYYDLSDGELK